MPARQCHDGVGIETKRGTGGGAFEERSALRVPDNSIRDRRRVPVDRATRWNAEALETWPAPVLAGGPMASLDHLDHDVGLTRRRSPCLKPTGGSAAGSTTPRPIRPMRLQP